MRHEHEAEIEVRAGVITVSTSRYQKYGGARGLEKLEEIDDPSGNEIARNLECKVEEYILVPDERAEIVKALVSMLPKVDAVIITGGTGLTPLDVTIEAVEPLFEKKIDGFGEIFRYLSFKEVGTAAILSRATAGIIKGRAVFCLPGSKKAVRLAVNLINDSLKHIISHARGLR
ncbi:MAG: MogA/MoaB family molybdenum cofactor biosynthesis protein [Archaeoglobus sp.]|nr:MogA/MoaB family molybdenum cofactor biosynthesis protein [Archaeoglobus sp.]